MAALLMPHASGRDDDPLLQGGNRTFLGRMTGGLFDRERDGAPFWRLFSRRSPYNAALSGPPPDAQPQDVETGLGAALGGAPAPLPRVHTAPQALEAPALVAGGPAEIRPAASGVVIDVESGRASVAGGSPTSGRKGGSPRDALLRRVSSLSRAGSAMPVCLICLENLTPDDFESGEAIALECQCRGELALRHRSCAEKWARVKGDRNCDVCKAPVRNLPEVTPRARSDGSEPPGSTFGDGPDANHGAHGAALAPYLADSVPGSADIIFDCIRVTWVAMIICILFFEMNLAAALWTGLVVGVAYTMFARAMYRQQLAAIQGELAREEAARLAARAPPPAPSPQPQDPPAPPRSADDPEIPAASAAGEAPSAAGPEAAGDSVAVAASGPAVAPLPPGAAAGAAGEGGRRA